MLFLRKNEIKIRVWKKRRISFLFSIKFLQRHLNTYYYCYSQKFNHFKKSWNICYIYEKKIHLVISYVSRVHMIWNSCNFSRTNTWSPSWSSSTWSDSDSRTTSSYPSSSNSKWPCTPDGKWLMGSFIVVRKGFAYLIAKEDRSRSAELNSYQLGQKGNFFWNLNIIIIPKCMVSLKNWIIKCGFVNWWTLF